MLKYPHVAERVKEEIAQVIGSHRPPALDDHSKMPYTEAVIHEIQRFGDLLPIGVPHIVTKDTVFRGYLIPKNTEVYPILSSALHDPHYFKEPDTFNPDHFLDANGALKKNEAFIPFSAEEGVKGRTWRQPPCTSAGLTETGARRCTNPAGSQERTGTHITTNPTTQTQPPFHM
ncbi:cytochrome P450 2B1-like [Ictidomys tridecemlineatus]|nr:cytochrome P450 2B1-like [Ictidomys tridecemlineatus]